MKTSSLIAIVLVSSVCGFVIHPVLKEGYNKFKSFTNPNYVCKVSGAREDYYPVNYNLTVSPEVVNRIKTDSYFDGMKVTLTGYQTEEEKMFYVKPTDDTTIDYSVECIKN
jgi:hypothetical protein